MKSIKFSLFSGVLHLVCGIIVLFFIFGGSKTIAQDEIFKLSPDSDAQGGEIKFTNTECLTDERRAEIQTKLRESIAKLRAEGKISDNRSAAAPSFMFPVKGINSAALDFGVHGISNFVDHDAAFPGFLKDYTCGTRTYDTTAGYNHKGIDIFTFPFGWLKMDNNEVSIVAADAGMIVFKSDGSSDRNCSFNSDMWNAVYVRHSDGTVSWYGHMKKFSQTTKAVGDTVAKGEYLGIVGSSGNSTGPHLHFELYSPTGALQDPYAGTCNAMNPMDYWDIQPPYRDSKINKLMTHSAAPFFGICPSPETPGEKKIFAPGDSPIFAAYYHDQTVSQVSSLSLIKPDGSTYLSWSHTSPSTYNASYWFWTRTIATDAPTGLWKFKVVFESATYEKTFSVLAPTAKPFDFDGDTRTDISIYRPSVGEWWYEKSSTGGNAAFQFGTSTDTIVPADYTGDDKNDVAIWRSASGEWFVLRSEDFSYYSFPFGTVGDVPAPADFDGDGIADPTVFRPSNSTWYISKSTGGTTIEAFGASGDAPVASDYDGDGKADIAIWRASAGEWWIKQSTLGVVAHQFGASTDKAVQGDFTGDARTDVAIWRPSTGEWFILRSDDFSYYSFPFGTNGDIPAPGDYDGDGKFDAAVFRPSDSNWYVQMSTAGTLIKTFGIATDKPVPNAFVP